MQRNLNTLYVAVVAGICGLIWAQIAAPTQFKPLTSRLLDYPGKSIPTVLNISSSIPRIQFSKSPTKLVWNPISQVQIAMIREDGKTEKIPLKPTKLVVNKPQVTTTVRPNKADEEEVPDPIPAPASTPPVTVQSIQQDVYTAINGTETLRYGYQLTAADTYVDKANGETCTDGQGTISGTYCAPNGQRYNVASQGNANAANAFNQKVAEKVATLSNEQVSQAAQSIKDNNCSASDIVCNTTKIAQAALTVDNQETIQKVVEVQQANQKAQEEYQANIKAFLDPNTVIPGGMPVEAYLQTKGVDPGSISALVAARQQNIDYQSNFNNIASLYLDTSKTDIELAQLKCKTDLKCVRDFKREDIITGIDKNSADYQLLIKRNNEYDLASKFADATITNSDLAKDVCNDDFGCIKNFERSDYLNVIRDPELVASAKANYQVNLFNLTAKKDTPEFANLPQALQNSITNANTNITKAFAAYIFDKNKTPGSIVTAESTQASALEFGEMIKDDPALIDKWLKDFNSNKKLYEGYINAPGIQLFNYLASEQNPVIKAQINDIISHATISGLSNNGQILSWDKVSSNYKKEARELACKTDESLYEACSFISFNEGSPDPEKSKQAAIYTAQIEQKLQSSSEVYLKDIFNSKTSANMPLSISFSSVATINNPLVDEELRSRAIRAGEIEVSQRNYANARYNYGNYLDIKPVTPEEKTQIANDYLDRRLVTETYKVGGGLVAGAAGFSAGMLLCAATVVGAAVSPICGAIGGLAGWAAAQIPLYEKTAVEYQQQRTSIAEVLGGSELASGIAQGLVSNQGAWGDEGAGRSITTRNNQFALYDSITNQMGGQTIDQIRSNQNLQSNIAIQGLVLNQWEKNQNIQEKWTYASAGIAAITGGINVSVGSSLATNFVNKSLSTQSYAIYKLAADSALFIPSTLLNQAQTVLQFNATGGNSDLLSTQEQINYQVCVMSKGIDSCDSELNIMNDSIDQSRQFTMQQAFITDSLMQAYQTGSGYRAAQAEFQGQVVRAQELGIPTTDMTLGDIQLNTSKKLNDIADTLQVSTRDLEHLNNPELILALRAAETVKLDDIQTPPGLTSILGNLSEIIKFTSEIDAQLPSIEEMQNIAPSADSVGYLIASKKVTVEIDADNNNKPRLVIDETQKSTMEINEIELVQRVNEHITTLEKQSSRPGSDFTIREAQLDAVVKTLNLLADIAQGKASKNDLYIDITQDPGANPNSRTGGGKTTVIAPLVEALMIDDGVPVIRLAPEKNLAGNIAAVKALGSDFYGTDIYIATNEKNPQGEIVRQFFTDLEGNEVPSAVIYNRAEGKKPPVIIADADTALFGLNETVRIERKLGGQLSENGKAWYWLWQSSPNVTIDEVGVLGGHWSTSIGDAIKISNLKQSEATLYLKNGNEVLSVFADTDNSTVIKQAKNKELKLTRKNGSELSLAPLDETHQSTIIDESISKGLSDKKISGSMKAELERIQNIADFTQRRGEFNALKQLSPIEIDLKFGKNSAHAVALLNAYNDAVMSRLTILAGVPGNDFKGVLGSDNLQRVELAFSKTVTGQQFSEIMMRLALQHDGAARLTNDSGANFAPLSNLTVSPSSVVVDLYDMYSHAGYTVGFDASSGLAGSKTGLTAVYGESNDLHAPTSVSLANNLSQASKQLAIEAQAQFDNGKMALVVDTNVDKYSLDDATTSHTRAVYESANAKGQELYLALNAGDGKYEVYKINGPDRSNWELISSSADSAESLYLQSHQAIEGNPNAKLLAIFENKTRGENYKPSDRVAPDIAKITVLANNDTAIAENVYQAVSRLRTNDGDPSPSYHLVTVVQDGAALRDLQTKPDLNNEILTILKNNQQNAEGLIALERNISLMNEKQVNQLLGHLLSESADNPKLQAQLEELNKQIKNSGAAFANMPSYEKTTEVLHNQYTFTRGRLENILKMAESGGMAPDKISSLRASFNLDDPSLTLQDFESMRAGNFDASKTEGYHKTLAANVSSMKNLPENYLSGSPKGPVTTQNGSNMASAIRLDLPVKTKTGFFSTISTTIAKLNPFSSTSLNQTQKSPLSLALLVDRRDFESFSLEDKDGTITRIEKIGDKIMFSQSAVDEEVITSREFNVTDLALLPSSENVLATHYNNKLLDKSDYVSPKERSFEALKAMIESEDFQNLSFALENGSTVTISLENDKIQVVSKPAVGQPKVETPTYSQILIQLEQLSDQIVALNSNGEDIELMPNLAITSEPKPKSNFVANIFSYLGNLNTEKGGSFKLSLNSNNTPSQPNLTSMISAPDFKSLIIRLKSGQVATFTNLLGNISYSIAIPESGEMPKSKVINGSDLPNYLPASKNDIEELIYNDKLLAETDYSIPAPKKVSQLQLFFQDLFNNVSDYPSTTVSNTTQLNPITDASSDFAIETATNLKDFPAGQIQADINTSNNNVLSAISDFFKAIINDISSYPSTTVSNTAQLNPITDTSNDFPIQTATNLKDFPGDKFADNPSLEIIEMIANPNFKSMVIRLTNGQVATFTNQKGSIVYAISTPESGVMPISKFINLRDISTYIPASKNEINTIDYNGIPYEGTTVTRLNKYFLKLGQSIKNWLFSLNSSRTQPTRSPISHNTAALKTAENQYLSDNLPKMNNLDLRYEHESTGDQGYRSDMDRYIGTPQIRAPKNANVSRRGIEQVRKNIKPEIKRLFLNQATRLNQEKFDIVTWEVNRYLDLIEQAIDEGDISTKGTNALTLADVQEIVLRNIHTLAFQDYVATTNTLGDHGVRHLVDHNIRVGEKVLALSLENNTSADRVRAIDYLILHQSNIDHDTGYATGIVRAGVDADATKKTDSGHNLLGAKILSQRTEGGTDPLSYLFQAEGIARIHQGILKHDGSSIDISGSRATTVDSAIHLGDNTHAFESKLPELLYGYPESIIAMRLLKAAGEIGDEELIEEIRNNLINTIRNDTSLGHDDQEALVKAVGTLNKNSYAFTAGRILGSNPVITYENGKLVVSVTESDIHRDVVKFFDQKALAQLAKFLEDILKSESKDSFLQKLNGDTTRFEGDSVVIQALTGSSRVGSDRSTFQTKLSELTSENEAFTAYINEDDTARRSVSTILADIKSASNQLPSVFDQLATRAFDYLTITLSNGDILSFSNHMGQIALARYNAGSSYPQENKYISTDELLSLINSISNQSRVMLDGKLLDPGSYTLSPSISSAQQIEQLNEKLMAFQQERANYIRNYLNSINGQAPADQTQAEFATQSHNVLNGEFTITSTKDGYLVKATNPASLYQSDSFSAPTQVPAEGIFFEINNPYDRIKLIVGTKTYDLVVFENALTVIDGKGKVEASIQDHLTSFEKLIFTITSLSLRAERYVVNIFNPNESIKDNLDIILRNAAGDTLIPDDSIGTQDPIKAILIGQIKYLPYGSLRENTLHFVARELYHSEEDNILALEDVIATADLLYKYLELETFRGVLTLTSKEQLIGTPLIRWGLNPQSIDLSLALSSSNKSILDHLNSGHSITIESKDTTKYISADSSSGSIEYVITTTNKTTNTASINRTKNPKRLAEEHFPSADDLDLRDYQVYITTATGANLHSSSLIDLLLKSIKVEIPQESRSGLQQWWSRTLGLDGVGILAYPGPVTTTISHTQAFDEFRSKWEQIESIEIIPNKQQIEVLQSEQDRMDKIYTKILELIEQMETKHSLSSIRDQLAKLGYPYLAEFGHTENGSLRLVISPDQEYYDTAIKWLYLQRAYALPEILFPSTKTEINKLQHTNDTLLSQKQEEFKELENIYGSAFSRLSVTYDEMLSKLPRSNGETDYDLIAWQKENADKTFTLKINYVLGTTDAQLPLDQVTERHGMEFRDKDLSTEDVAYLTSWLLQNRDSIDWLAIAGQHVNEGTETYGNYPYFDPLISSSMTGLKGTGDQEMTFKVKGDKLIPWSILAEKRLVQIRKEIGRLGFDPNTADGRYWLAQRKFWGGKIYIDGYLVIGEITLDELVANSTRPELKKDIEKYQKSQNLTGCSNCNIVIPQTIAKALTATTESEINQVIKEHEANHSYSDPHLQSAVDAILLAIKSNLTKESIDYDQSIKAIQATRLLLEQYGQVEPGPSMLGLPPSIAKLPWALQSVLTTLPVRGSLGAGKITNHFEALQKLEDYLERAKLRSNPSSYWTRLGRANFHNLNALTRKWNDLFKRNGQVVGESSLALDAETYDPYELNDAKTFDPLETQETFDDQSAVTSTGLPTLKDADLSVELPARVVSSSTSNTDTLESFLAKDLRTDNYILTLSGVAGQSNINSMTIPVASPVLRKLFILDEIKNLFTIYPGLQSVDLDGVKINRADLPLLGAAIITLNSQYKQLEKTEDQSLISASNQGEKKLIDNRYIVSQNSYNSGGMGTVSLGWDTNLRIPIIIKTINKDSSLYKKYLKQETTTIAQLKAIKIPTAYDIVEENEVLYYVMGYVSGPSLFKYIQTSAELGQPLRTQETLDIIEDISHSLDFIHLKTIDGIPLVHGDIKPGNIAINADIGSVILDFGIANAVLRKVHGVENYQKLNVYTPMYYAPSQQKDGIFKQEARHDNRSMVLISYVMMTGTMPYSSDNLMFNILNGNWNKSALLSKINQAYSAKIQSQIMEFFDRAMRDDDAFFEEYPTAQSIYNELYRLLSQTKK